MPGLFITLEGIEGVGKSTCIRYLSRYLEQHGVPFIVTREPGGTPFAEEIRNLLLHHHAAEPIHHDTELLLLFAARAQHISEVILPALAEGKWVLCDRFTDASYAYQGGGRRVDPKRIQILEHWVQEDFRPDVVLLLDAPAKKALHRISRRKQLDRLEREEVAFFRRVRRAYLTRAEKFPRRYRVIDASKPLSVVKRSLQDIVDPLIFKIKK
jgi:dTMP kinase